MDDLTEIFEDFDNFQGFFWVIFAIAITLAVILTIVSIVKSVKKRRGNNNQYGSSKQPIAPKNKTDSEKTKIATQTIDPFGLEYSSSRVDPFGLDVDDVAATTADSATAGAVIATAMNNSQQAEQSTIEDGEQKISFCPFCGTPRESEILTQVDLNLFLVKPEDQRNNRPRFAT